MCDGIRSPPLFVARVEPHSHCPHESIPITCDRVAEPLSWDLPEDRGLKWVWYISIFCMIVSILLTLKEYVLHKRFENQCVKPLLHPNCIVCH